MKIYKFINKPSVQYGLNSIPLVSQDLLLIEDGDRINSLLQGARYFYDNNESNTFPL